MGPRGIGGNECKEIAFQRRNIVLRGPAPPADRHNGGKPHDHWKQALLKNDQILGGLEQEVWKGLEYVVKTQTLDRLQQCHVGEVTNVDDAKRMNAMFQKEDKIDSVVNKVKVGEMVVEIRVIEDPLESIGWETKHGMTVELHPQKGVKNGTALLQRKKTDRKLRIGESWTWRRMVVRRMLILSVENHWKKQRVVRRV
ncbi:hypothetical protein RIF29_16296 [Crotalaria pallida]|uniref:Uncharacterized protein n=1 Tax=Crotalaria pallida TaxID=3830 RepID=A0AAN9FEU7_CROPI